MDGRLVILSVLTLLCEVFAVDPIVESSLGTIRGVLTSDGNINMFMGIPYANVNESNPFGRSSPHPGFDTVFEANDSSVVCPQIDEFNRTPVGHPDCLQLNVYTPSYILANSSLPVMIWIYGGRHQNGYALRFLYGPEFLVRHDVILVTINYRVGPYGYMCLDIPEVPGNQGLKDTLLALRWVKDHIASFGGNPEQITVTGHSAGGHIVDFHLMRDEQLFHRAILQSGTTQVLVGGPPVTNLPVLIANELGFQTDEVHAAIAFLATASPADVVQTTLDLGVTCWPCVEKPFDGVDAFLTESVNTADYYVQNVSIIIGITDDEQFGMQFGNDDPGSVDFVLGLRFDPEHENFTGSSDVRHFYYGDETSSERATADLFSDIHFNHPSYRVMERILSSNPERLYTYLFTYVGDRNFARRQSNVVGGGALHADEIGYMFTMELIPETPTPEDQLVIDMLTTMWTNFVKYGLPTPQSSQLLPVQWPPITATSPQYCLRIDGELSIITRPFHDRMTFWDLFYEANDHARITNH